MLKTDGQSIVIDKTREIEIQSYIGGRFLCVKKKCGSLPIYGHIWTELLLWLWLVSLLSVSDDSRWQNTIVKRSRMDWFCVHPLLSLISRSADSRTAWTVSSGMNVDKFISRRIHLIHTHTLTYLALISSNRIIKIFKPFILFHSINHVQLLFAFLCVRCATTTIIFAYSMPTVFAWRNFSSTDFSQSLLCFALSHLRLYDHSPDSIHSTFSFFFSCCIPSKEPFQSYNQFTTNNANNRLCEQVSDSAQKKIQNSQSRTSIRGSKSENIAENLWLEMYVGSNSYQFEATSMLIILELLFLCQFFFAVKRTGAVWYGAVWYAWRCCLWFFWIFPIRCEIVIQFNINTRSLIHIPLTQFGIEDK